jgi:hypothetical protein
MATRWSFCERGGRIRRAPFPVLASLALVCACVSTVTRYYVPDARNPRFDIDGGTAVLDQYLRVQCPERLASGKPGRGDVRITIQTDTSGAVVRAELVSSTGDEMLDGLFGMVAAQLRVDSLRATAKPVAERVLRAGYRCAPDTAVATLEVLRS